MSYLKITLYPIDFETPFSLNDCVMSIAILSEEMGLGYRLSSSGATVEGNKPDLLTFLRHLKNETSGKFTDKVVMIVSFPDEDKITHSARGGNPTLEETVLEMIG